MQAHGSNTDIIDVGTDVIYQQTYSYTAISRGHQPLSDQPSGNIGVIDVVLDIQAVLGHVNQPNPRSECICTVMQDDESRLRRVRRALLCQIATQLG